MDYEFFTNNNPFAFFAVVYNTHKIFGDIYSDIFGDIYRYIKCHFITTSFMYWDKNA